MQRRDTQLLRVRQAASISVLATAARSLAAQSAGENQWRPIPEVRSCFGSGRRVTGSRARKGFACAQAFLIEATDGDR